MLKSQAGEKRAQIMLSLAEKAEVKKDFFSVLTKIFLLTRTGKKCVEKQKPEEGSERKSGSGNCAMNNISYHEIAIYNHSFPLNRNVSCTKAYRVPVTQKRAISPSMRSGEGKIVTYFS